MLPDASAPPGKPLLDCREAPVHAPANKVFEAIRRIGGANGWYYSNWLWQLRGAIDTLMGGPGMRRGRRDRDRLEVGDVVDCWRVEVFEPNRRLRLVAEMKLPGRAWLEFEVIPNGAGSTIRQTAIFHPSGLLGKLYWYLVYPVHQLVFAGMLRGLVASVGDPPAIRALTSDLK